MAMATITQLTLHETKHWLKESCWLLLVNMHCSYVMLCTRHSLITVINFSEEGTRASISSCDTKQLSSLLLILVGFSTSFEQHQQHNGSPTWIVYIVSASSVTLSGAHRCTTTICLGKFYCNSVTVNMMENKVSPTTRCTDTQLTVNIHAISYVSNANIKTSDSCSRCASPGISFASLCIAQCVLR